MPDNKYGKKAFKYSGLLRSFFAWPLYIGAVLIIICAIMFCVNVTAATVVSIFMVIYLMACGLMYLYETKNNVRNSGVCIQLFSGSEATFV